MITRRFSLCLLPLAIATTVSADSWTPISIVNAPTARTAHSAIFTRIDGTDHMIVWGGQDSSMVPFADTGGLWKRSTNQWTATSTDNVPSGREGHPAIWTGHEMIVWGGDDGLNFLNTGGRYNPVKDEWLSTSLTGAPSPRFGHALVWTGDRMIVWAGAIGFAGDVNDGALYDPVTDTWSPVATIGAPSPRNHMAAVWTGSQMLVWGGISLGTYVNDGGTL